MLKAAWDAITILAILGDIGAPPAKTSSSASKSLAEICVLQEITRCSGANGVEHIAVIIEYSEHDHRDPPGQLQTNFFNSFNARHSRHVDVHQYNVWLNALQLVDDLEHIGKRSAHFVAVAQDKHARNAFAQRFVVLI